MKIGFLRDADGDWSSKRLFGLTCLIVAAVATFTGADWQLVGAWLAPAAVVFGVQAATGT